MIRQMTDRDIPLALGLCRQADWNQLQTDWLRLIQYEPGGCFVAELDKQIVGTVTTTRYETDLAWIGMMLVDDRFRRRGIATKLMKTSLNYLQEAGVSCIKLDATASGRPLYERLGFQIEGLFHRWAHDGQSPQRPQPRRGKLSSSHFQLDHSAFGARRDIWLKRTAADSQLVTSCNSFGMARDGFLANYLGPVVAVNEPEATQIVRELLSQLDGQTFWDVPPDNPTASAIAKSLGFQPVRDLARMRIGSMPAAPEMHLQFALSDPGTG